MAVILDRGDRGMLLMGDIVFNCDFAHNINTVKGTAFVEGNHNKESPFTSALITDGQYYYDFWPDRYGNGISLALITIIPDKGYYVKIASRIIKPKDVKSVKKAIAELRIIIDNDKDIRDQATITVVGEYPWKKDTLGEN